MACFVPAWFSFFDDLLFLSAFFLSGEVINRGFFTITGGLFQSEIFSLSAIQNSPVLIPSIFATYFP